MCLFLKIICNLYVEMVFFLEWEMGEFQCRSSWGLCACRDAVCRRSWILQGLRLVFGKKPFSSAGLQPLKGGTMALRPPVPALHLHGFPRAFSPGAHPSWHPEVFLLISSASSPHCCSLLCKRDFQNPFLKAA